MHLRTGIVLMSLRSRSTSLSRQRRWTRSAMAASCMGEELDHFGIDRSTRESPTADTCFFSPHASLA
jgi:hypothetical protein